MQLIGELPLSSLDELLSFAEAQEAEKATRGLWIAHYALSKLTNTDPIPHETFLNMVIGKEEISNEGKKLRSADEIMAEFAPIVESDRQKSAERG